jgi:hypothetical protein
VISLVLEPIDGQPLTAALNGPIYVKFPVNFPVAGNSAARRVRR